jgi:predicted acylesterase/phospholipase RssA/CRP-like cAMP-binding protein
MTLAALRELPHLASMDDEALVQLEAHCQWHWHQPGEAIVRQGEPGTDFYMVVRGQVELMLEGEIPTRLALLGPGEFFGESAALSGEPAPATVIARETSSLLRLAREGLLLLLEQNHDLSRQIIATLAVRQSEAWLRLHRTRLRERSLADHVARQSARVYTEWVGSGAWSQRVRAAIARGSRSVEPVIFVGEVGAGKELAAARLHYNSLRKDGPFLVVDGADWSESRWNEAVRMAAHGSLLIKRADAMPPEAVAHVAQILPPVMKDATGRLPGRVPRLLATASPAEDREPSQVEELLLDEGYALKVPALRERPEDIPALVRHFLRKFGHRVGGMVPAVSSAALRRLASHPFQQDNVRELERVLHDAVLLAGGGEVEPQHLRLTLAPGQVQRPRIGLALGGGAARGGAHVGVLRAFEEEGIPIDCIAGTSSGALVGALYAGGLGTAALQELTQGLGWFDLAEPTWPGAGFLTSRRMRSLMDRHIGPVTFADLKLPFAAIAADANTGEEKVLRSGRVADAVRASTAIPGVFKPVEFEGRLLVDGVVVNNVPAPTARALGADVVIAVDVTGYGFEAGAPRSIAEAITRSFDIMARQTVTASLEWADLVIRPQISGLNGYSTKTAAEFARRGYLAAKEAMPEVKARIAEVRRQMGL